MCFIATLEKTDASDMNEHHKELASLLEHLTELMEWDTMIDCYMDNTGHSVMIPWHYVPSLVAQRMVRLYRS